MLNTIIIIIIIQKMQKNIYEASMDHSFHKYIECLLCAQHVLSFEGKAENTYEFKTSGCSVKHQDIRFSQ